MPTDPTRSRIMRSVRRADTKPELALRPLLHSMGFRFRLHRRDMPGTPDIVLPKHRTVIFVHGCFWHRHRDCPKATTPKSRVEFWGAKVEANVARDRRNQAQLESQGWRVLIVWECEVGDLVALRRRIRNAFDMDP